MKKLFLLIVLIGLGKVSTAQQQPIFTNFLLNPFFYNPAYSGVEPVHRANLNYRNQWTGFAGAPITFSGSVFGSYKDKLKHGYGAMIVSDKVGLTSRTGVYGNYSYQLKLNKKTRLGMGVTAGYLQYRVKLYDVKAADNGDELLTGNILSQNGLDVNVGLFLHHEKFFLGISGSQLLARDLNFAAYNSEMEMHFNVAGGYSIKTGKNMVLQPLFMLRYSEPVPMQADLAIKGIWQEKIWLATTYRTDEAVCLSAGYQFLERINIGYSYDYSIGPISSYQSGTHEVCLSFALTKKKKSIEELDEELNNSIMDSNKKKMSEEEFK